MFAAVKSGKEITIPSGWPGHAIVINLAPSQEKPYKSGAVGFDLRVFNLGIGSRFHQSAADPQGNFPYLVKPWINYINIPWKAVEEVRFFVLGLMNLHDERGMSFLLGDKGPDYFYNEFLANFAPYYKEDDKDLFVVPQRSGSCTVSSLMARVLFAHNSIAEYMRSRVKIGLTLLANFCNTYRNNSKVVSMAQAGVEFKKILNFTLSSLAKDALSQINSE